MRELKGPERQRPGLVGHDDADRSRGRIGQRGGDRAKDLSPDPRAKLPDDARLVPRPPVRRDMPRQGTPAGP